jgi:hypothetical protein
MIATTGHLFVPLLVATGVASAAWMVLFAGWYVLSRPGHVDPGPAVMLDLEHEPLPPALVNLLVNRGHVENEAMASTLIDLAARGIVSIERSGPQQEICRIQPAAGTADLLAHERWVLERVESRASGGTVPLAALNSAPAGVDAWRKRFAGMVVGEARSRGVARPRMTLAARVVLVLTALVPAGLAFAAGKTAPVTHAKGTQTPPPSAGAVEAAIVLIVFMGIVFVLPRLSDFGGQRTTPEGAQLAARWLGFREYLRRDPVFSTLPPAAVAVWKRNLSYGTALGAAAAAARALPFGPEPDREAWSPATGQWRIVRVTYPRRLLWGRSPWRSLLRGLLLLIVAAGVTYGYEYARHHAAQFTQQNISQGLAVASIVIFAFVVPVFGLFGLTYFWRGLIDLFSATEVRGLVIRLRRYRTRQMNSSGRQANRGYVAVDDGSSGRVRAYQVDLSTYGRLQEGMNVRFRATKHLGYVSNMSVVDPRNLASVPVAAPVAPVPGVTTPYAAAPAPQNFGTDQSGNRIQQR